MWVSLMNRKKAELKCILHFISVRPHLTNKHLFSWGPLYVGNLGKLVGKGYNRYLQTEKGLRNKDILERSIRKLFSPCPLKTSFFLNCDIMLYNYDLELPVGIMWGRQNYLSFCTIFLLFQWSSLRAISCFCIVNRRTHIWLLAEELHISK